MRFKRPMCVLSLIFMLMTWVFTFVKGGVDISEKTADYTKVCVDGIIEDKAYKNYSNIIYIKVGNTSSFRNFSRLAVYLDRQEIEDFSIGQAVRINGLYSNFPVAENKGQFCMRTYYRIHGYEAKITKAEVAGCSEGFSVYKDFLFNIKERTKSVYRDNMSLEHYGTITAMVLGDKNDLDKDTKTLFQNAGISHILSLSGLHIAAIGLCVFSFLYRAGLGNRGAAVVSSVVMISYGVMTGLSTSTFRALIMFLLGVIAKCIGRTYDLLSAVCVSAIIILVENPLYIYDSGFLMSLLSVIGIGIIYPVLEEVTRVEMRGGKVKAGEKLCKLKFKGNNGRCNEMEGIELCKLGFISKVLDKVRQSVCISMSATLATLPVVAGSFYKISRYGILVNIIIVPAMSVVLFLGIIGGITGFAWTGTGGGLLYGLHKLSKLILRFVECILGFFNYTSAFAGSVPGNTWVIGKPSGVAILVYIIIILAAFSGIGRNVCIVVCRRVYIRKYKKRQKNNSDFGRDNAENTFEKKQLKTIYKKAYFINTVLLTVLAVFTISFRSENDFSVDVLSIGQGACNVIHGNDIPAIMIDAGSTDVKEAGKYRVIPNLLSKGIDKIDYLFVTHPDEDHISAVKELLEDKACGIKVKALVFSIVDDSIAALEEEYGVPVYSFNAGQVISGRGYEIRAIYPEYRAGITWQNVDANEESLVLKITHKPTGFTALFTGDIGVKAEEKILQGHEEENIDFMTVAHHGSKNSSCEQFLSYANPLICTISAGKDNRYGHPHQTTLDKLAALNIPHLITYKTGEINICIDKSRCWVENFRD